jgi:hypothetical protein
MKRASIQLRLAAFLCLFGVLFMIVRIIQTRSYDEAKDYFIDDARGFIALGVMLLVGIPVSLYVVLTNREPGWAAGQEAKFPKNRKELILKAILLMILIILIAVVALVFRHLLVS